MGRVTNKYYGYCPLVEDFHIKNVIGDRERRQIIFGYSTTISSGTSKALTLSGMTGGLITTADHMQVLAQNITTAATAIPRISAKTELGFTLNGDNGSLYHLIVIATLPIHSRANPKWAKDYCPGCKNLDFWAVAGSIYKDIALFHFRVQNGVGGTLAVTFRAQTAYYGDLTTDLQIPGVKGSSPSPLVSLMANDDYQVICFPSASAATAWPTPSSLTAAGFTLTADASEYYNILILGQILN